MLVLVVDMLLIGGARDLVDAKGAFVKHDRINCDKQGVSKQIRRRSCREKTLRTALPPMIAFSPSSGTLTSPLVTQPCSAKSIRDIVNIAEL